MSTRANLIKCRGLVTHGNELSRPEGSLRQAINVNVDEDGVVTPRRGFNDYGAATGGSESTSNITKQMMQYKDSLIRHYQDKLEFEDLSNTFQSVNGSYTELRTGIRIKSQEANSNLYFTTSSGVKKISAKSKSDLNADMVTDAGGIKAGYGFGTIVPTTGGFLPPQSKVAYRLLIGTKDANGNLIYGSPSARFVVTNFSEDIGSSEISTVEVLDANNISDNDYFTYANNSGKYVIYFNSDPDADPPQTADTIAGTYVRSSYIQTATPASDDPATAAILANAIATNIQNVEVAIDSTDNTKINITSTEEGDIEGLASNSNGTAIGIGTQDGSISEGSFANVQIVGVVPNGTTTDYFYQVYRTAFIEAAEGLTLNDIDPGDECNLVYEAAITEADIAAGEFSVLDNTPDSYRAANAPLYSNEITGEGILQSNEAPPIALDVELFRSSMFYANTKSRHSLQFDLVSVDNFISGSTRFIVGNDEVTRYYNFTGTKEVTELTVNESNETTEGSYILIESANNERVYYVWFDKGSDPSKNPEIPGAIGYRVVLSDANDTTPFSVADKIRLSLSDNSDISVEFPYSEWDSTVDYLDGDMVIYEGKIYEALSDNTNKQPDTEPEWSDQGDADTLIITHANNGYTKGVRLVDDWSSTKEYETGDKVLYGTNVYEALSDNVDKQPDTEPEWSDLGLYTAYITSEIGTGWAINVTTVGTGELSDTDDGGDILLSGLGSTAQAIDETARSLVKIISQDDLSPVNAYYLSTTEDLPGQILLENRSLEDRTFYIAIEENSDTEIGDEFSPAIPYSREMDEINITFEHTAIKLTNHGYSNEQQLFLSYLDESSLPSTGNTFSGIYNIEIIFNIWDLGTNYSTYDRVVYNSKVYLALQNNTNSQPDLNPLDWKDLGDDTDVFFISRESSSVELNINPIYSAIFSADVESDNAESPNRLFYSKINEPEAVPSINYIDVGPKDEEIRRIVALRDNLFVLKDDGIYIVSGTSAPNFSVRLLDNARILAPDSAVVLNNQIYCLTEQGVTVVTDSGAGVISRNIEDLIDEVTNRDFDFAPNTFGIAYENDRAYILFCPTTANDTSATQAFRYNIFERTWTIWEYEATCGLVMERDNKMYLGNGDRNYTSKERKNNNRTDQSDRDFLININSNGVQGTTVELSTLSDVKVSDVLVQEQLVTINYLNRRLLVKMDLFDTGVALGESGGVVSYSDTATANFYTPYPHRLENGSEWTIRIEEQVGLDIENSTITRTVTVIDDNNFTIEYDSTSRKINSAIFIDYFARTFMATTGDNIASKMEDLNYHLYLLTYYNADNGDLVQTWESVTNYNEGDKAEYNGLIYEALRANSNAIPDEVNSEDWKNITIITNKTFTNSNVRAQTELLVEQLNLAESITSTKTYKKPTTVYYEAYIKARDINRNQVELHAERPWIEGEIRVYKHFTQTIEWNPQHFGDPSALKQIRYVSIMFDQNNFYDAVAKFASDAAQAVKEVKFQGKGIGYWGDMPWADPNHYWGGVGNDIPFRNPVPRGKQKCRYLSLTFEHKNAREYFKIVGISGVVRAISDRAYR